MAEPRYLLDSNICIYILDRTSSAAVDRFERCQRGELATSSIVYAEVMLGAAMEGQIERAERFFELLDILPFGDSAALKYARLPFRRHSFDRLIAAHAISLDLTVVTSNLADFADIPELRIEDWTK